MAMKLTTFKQQISFNGVDFYRNPTQSESIPLDPAVKVTDVQALLTGFRVTFGDDLHHVSVLRATASASVSGSSLVMNAGLQMHDADDPLNFPDGANSWVSIGAVVSED
jgi:hypothetical protein